MKHPLLLSSLLIALFITAACSGGDDSHQNSDPSLEENAGSGDQSDADGEENDAESDADGEEDQGDKDDDGDGDDLDPPGPPEIDLFPSTLSFSGVAPGSTSPATVTIYNLGESPLLLLDAQLNQFGVTGSEVFLPSSWPSFPITLEPTTFRDLEILFAPETSGSFRGEFLIFSDDPDQDYVSIRIETISFDAELEAPERVSFGTVSSGDSETLRIEVYNRGSAPLQLHPPHLSSTDDQHQAFSVEVLGLPSLPGFLERNAFVYMDITFAPDDDSLHTADLTFQTSDPLYPEFTIALTGNRPAPCIQTSGPVDFGTLNTGTSSERNFTILNCSFSRNLQVQSFEIADDGGGVFSFQVEPQDSLTIPPTQTRTLSLSATLQAEQAVVGTLRFLSNDPDAEIIEESLRVSPTSTDN